jgi:hypothetical protein
VAGALADAAPGVVNLGLRLFSIYTHPDVVRAIAPFVDVLSLNDYDYGATERPLLVGLSGGAEFGYLFGRDAFADLETLHALSGKPVLIGEWFYRVKRTDGAGTPLPPLFPEVASHAEQAVAYHLYAERVSALPFVIGYHWFQWMDQPREGRRDGENQWIGVVDIEDDLRAPLAAGDARGERQPDRATRVAARRGTVNRASRPSRLGRPRDASLLRQEREGLAVRRRAGAAVAVVERRRLAPGANLARAERRVEDRVAERAGAAAELAALDADARAPCTALARSRRTWRPFSGGRRGRRLPPRRRAGPRPGWRASFFGCACSSLLSIAHFASARKSVQGWFDTVAAFVREHLGHAPDDDLLLSAAHRERRRGEVADLAVQCAAVLTDARSALHAGGDAGVLGDLAAQGSGTRSLRPTRPASSSPAPSSR